MAAETKSGANLQAPSFRQRRGDDDYPLWLRATHFYDVLFLSLLGSSGIEILSANLQFYWNDDGTPGTQGAGTST